MPNSVEGQIKPSELKVGECVIYKSPYGNYYHEFSLWFHGMIKERKSATDKLFTDDNIDVRTPQDADEWIDIREMTFFSHRRILNTGGYEVIYEIDPVTEALEGSDKEEA